MTQTRFLFAQFACCATIAAQVTTYQPVRPVPSNITLGFDVMTTWRTYPHNGIDYVSSLSNPIASIGPGGVISPPYYTKPDAAAFGAINPNGSGSPGPAIWMKYMLATGEPVYVLYGHTATSWTDATTGIGSSLFNFAATYTIQWHDGDSIGGGTIVGRTAPFYLNWQLASHLHIGVFKPNKSCSGGTTYCQPPLRGWGYSPIHLLTGDYINPEDFFTDPQYMLQAPPPSTTLLHRYTFQGDANDAVGSANGTLIGGAVASGGKLMLNGSGAYVQFVGHLVPTSGSYSVTLFAQAIPPGLSIAELISQGFSTGPGFYLGYFTPSSTRIIRATDSWQFTGVPFPTDGQQHHYAFVVDAVANQSLLYLDGALMATFPSAITTTTAGTDTRLGRQFDPDAEYFHGALSDVRIYSGALSGQEVASLATSTVAYYRFEGGTANTAATGILDSTGGPGQNGISIGSPMYRGNVPVATIPQTGAPNALSLQFGTADSLRFNYEFPFNYLTNATLEFWLNPQAVDMELFWTRLDNNDTNRFHVFLGSGHLYVDYRDPSGTLHGPAYLLVGTHQVPTNAWTHFAIVKQGNNYSSYFNGQLDASATDTTPAMPTNTDGWTFNGRAYSGTPLFSGYLDEVRISNQALTPSQFLDHGPT